MDGLVAAPSVKPWGVLNWLRWDSRNLIGPVYNVTNRTKFTEELSWFFCSRASAFNSLWAIHHMDMGNTLYYILYIIQNIYMPGECYEIKYE